MKLCLGLMATNEETMLSRFLPDLSKAFDGEVVAINYGSTDGTKKILDENCKFVKTMEWPRNFGQAKTNVIKLAEESDYEWMFFIDADETVKSEDIQIIKDCIESNTYEMYFMPRIHFRSDNVIEGHLDRFPDMQARLFRLNMGFYYQNVRHCSLYRESKPLTCWEEKEGPVIPVFIRHYKMAEPKESQMLDEVKRLAMDFGFPEVTKIEISGSLDKSFEPWVSVKIKI